MAYIIWKASITEYRVKNLVTNEVKIMTDLNCTGCKFKVDIERYEVAKSKNFINSGDANDFFAWIEAEYITENDVKLEGSNVFYNPFKHYAFRDRLTLKVKHKANALKIRGNTLTY